MAKSRSWSQVYQLLDLEALCFKIIIFLRKYVFITFVERLIIFFTLLRQPQTTERIYYNLKYF